MPNIASDLLRVCGYPSWTQDSHERLDIHNQGEFFSINVFVELVDAKYQLSSLFLQLCILAFSRGKGA